MEDHATHNTAPGSNKKFGFAENRLGNSHPSGSSARSIVTEPHNLNANQIFVIQLQKILELFTFLSSGLKTGFSGKWWIIALRSAS